MATGRRWMTCSSAMPTRASARIFEKKTPDTFSAHLFMRMRTWGATAFWIERAGELSSPVPHP